MVHIAAEEFHFFGEIVVETEIHKVILQGLCNAGTETQSVNLVAHGGIVALRHHLP